jgi:hypothetical protein
MERFRCEQENLTADAEKNSAAADKRQSAKMSLMIYLRGSAFIRGCLNLHASAVPLAGAQAL